MPNQPNKEHLLLQQLIGKWSYESDDIVEPDKPQGTRTGTENIRALGPYWIIAEGKSDGEDTLNSVMILGYDPQKERFVGNTIVPSLSYLWPYEGILDESGQKLILESEGPSMEVEEEITKYRDILDVSEADSRTFTSNYLAKDGEWIEFMVVRYKRIG